MNTVKIRHTSGVIETIQAHRFKAYIGNRQYKFYFVQDRTDQIRVSHFESGQLFNAIMRTDSYERPIATAKRAICAVVDKYGSDRVQVVLNSAENIL